MVRNIYWRFKSWGSVDNPNGCRTQPRTHTPRLPCASHRSQGAACGQYRCGKAAGVSPRSPLPPGVVGGGRSVHPPATHGLRPIRTSAPSNPGSNCRSGPVWERMKPAALREDPYDCPQLLHNRTDHTQPIRSDAARREAAGGVSRVCPTSVRIVQARPRPIDIADHLEVTRCWCFLQAVRAQAPSAAISVLRFNGYKGTNDSRNEHDR